MLFDSARWICSTKLYIAYGSGILSYCLFEAFLKRLLSKNASIVFCRLQSLKLQQISSNSKKNAAIAPINTN